MSEANFTELVFDFEAVFDVDDYMYFYSDIITEEATERQVKFLIEALELSHAMQILDLACGFGRHANRLAALGHQVTGIDLFPGFLEKARQDAEVRSLKVSYQQGDMRNLSFIETFDGVLLLFTAFGYYSDEENIRVLCNVARALKPGGRFLFDIPNRDVMLKGFMPFSVTEKDGNLMIDRNTFDSLTGRITNQRIVFRDGVRKDKPFSIRVYNPSEIAAALAEAGLKGERIFGGFDGEPISVDSRRMVIIAKK